MIKILKFTPYQRGPLVGFVNIELCDIGIRINNVSVYRDTNRKWISMPTQKVFKEGEEEKYFPYVMFVDKEQKEKVQHEVFEALDELEKCPPF